MIWCFCFQSVCLPIVLYIYWSIYPAMYLSVIHSVYQLFYQLFSLSLSLSLSRLYSIFILSITLSFHCLAAIRLHSVIVKKEWVISSDRYIRESWWWDLLTTKQSPKYPSNHIYDAIDAFPTTHNNLALKTYKSSVLVSLYLPLFILSLQAGVRERRCIHFLHSVAVLIYLCLFYYYLFLFSVSADNRTDAVNAVVRAGPVVKHSHTLLIQKCTLCSP